jgi:peptidylprolyl isomerase domain and WD repeat-containing protein 1
VVPTPHSLIASLNNFIALYSIFGRATAGLDVIHAIEEARTDKTDKPYDDIKMVSIDIS